MTSSAFVRHNAILFVGSLLVGVLNYAYYPILGRLLSVEAYGEVQALVSLFLQLLIFLTVLGQVTVNVVANYDDEVKRSEVVFELEKMALYVSFAMVVIVAVFGWKLRTFFHFTSVWPFVVIMLAVVAAVPLNFRMAFLRGQKNFGPTAIANMIGAAGKIVLSAVLVAIGWGTLGAVWGVVIAQVLAFGYVAYVAKKTGFVRPSGSKRFGTPNWDVLRPELKYALFVLCGSLVVTMLSSIDIFVVKHFFDAKTAGRYAGVSTVARMIFFVTASVAQVLLPSVRINQSAKENRGFFLKSLALVCFMGGVGVIIFAVFSRRIVSLLMGHGYTTYAHLLGKLSLAMLIISILNLVVSYYIALRRYQSIVFVLAGAVVTGVLLALHHRTLDAVVTSLLYGSAIMLGMFAVWSIFLSTNKMREGHERTE